MKKKNNITVKIISVFFALILWFYVIEQENPKITKEIPNVKVELENLEYLNQANLVLADNNDFQISVKVSGRRSELINVTDKDIIARADIAGYQEGDNKIPIEVIVPAESKVLEDFNPKNILVKLDKVVERQVPVKLNIEDSLKNGYVIGNPSVKQRMILIRGPKSILNLVHEAVATVDLNGESKDIDITTPITLVDVNGKEIIQKVIKEPTVVDVYIPVLKIKTVNVFADITGNPSEGYEVTSRNVSPMILKIKGKENDIKDITSLTTGEVNINGLTKSLDTDIPIIIPDNVELLDENDTINVIVNIEKIIKKSFEYTIDELSIYNLDLELDFDKSQTTETISIEVQGIESKIKQTFKSDIKPFINMEDLSEGTHKVKVEMIKPYGIDVVRINPDELNVILVKPKKEPTNGDVYESETDKGTSQDIEIENNFNLGQ